MKKLKVPAFVVFYAFASAMHFITPEIYLKVIPDWLGNKIWLNYLAGITELLVALLAIFPKTRKASGYLAIAMLLAFIISHIYFIKIGNCAGGICIPAWVSWSRLLIVHPLLIYWAYSISKK